MTEKLPRVLIISSTNPTKGNGAVAMNFYNALKKYGVEVDFLTKHYVKQHPDFYYLYKFDRWPNYIGYKIQKKYGLEKRSNEKADAVEQQGDHTFDYGREDDPPIPADIVISKITKEYDVVYIVYWHRMLSYKTIEAIYNKLHCQIHLRCVDNQPVSGGCHFINDCPRLSEGCGFCPGLVHGEENDFTRYNIEYRRKIIQTVHPIIYGNTHMQMIYRKSALLRNYDRLETVYPVVDNEHFHVIDKVEARRILNINPTKKFIFFCGASDLTEERKGIKYLLESLKIFYSKLSDVQRKEVLLVVAGSHAEQLQERACFDTLCIGYVSYDLLPLYYSMANIFLSPSIDDAGPSMVNQSLSCGTPVVSFNIGTALDMILNENTGYCANRCDSDDFAQGIMSIYNSTEDQYENMCKCCRRVAIEKTSEKSFVDNFLRIYTKYKF